MRSPKTPTHATPFFDRLENVSRVGYGDVLMNVASSPSSETGTLEVRQAAGVSPLADDRLPSPSRRASRYALLRRMLACADLSPRSSQAARSSSSAVGVRDSLHGRSSTSRYGSSPRSCSGSTTATAGGPPVRVDEIPQLVVWGVLGTSGSVAGPRAEPGHAARIVKRRLAGVVAVVAVVALRAITRRSWRVFTPLERTAVIGNIAGVAASRRKLELFPELHMTIVDESESLEGIERAHRLTSVDRLVFAPEVLDEREVRDVLRVCRERDIALSLIPPCRTAFNSSFRLHHVAELPLLEYAGS